MKKKIAIIITIIVLWILTIVGTVYLVNYNKDKEKTAAITAASTALTQISEDKQDDFYKTTSTYFQLANKLEDVKTATKAVSEGNLVAGSVSEVYTGNNKYIVLLDLYKNDAGEDSTESIGTASFYMTKTDGNWQVDELFVVTK